MHGDHVYLSYIFMFRFSSFVFPLFCTHAIIIPRTVQVPAALHLQLQRQL